MKNKINIFFNIKKDKIKIEKMTTSEFLSYSLNKFKKQNSIGMNFKQFSVSIITATKPGIAARLNISNNVTSSNPKKITTK